MTPDDEKNEVFDYGDRTIFTLRAQAFDVDTEYGTMISRPANLLTVEMPLEAAIAPPVAEPPQAEAPQVEVKAEAEVDPLQRLEQKLDAALHAIAVLQQKLDSIDATLARALSR